MIGNIKYDNSKIITLFAYNGDGENIYILEEDGGFEKSLMIFQL